MRIKCILFDGDGVFINSETFSHKYEKEAGLEPGAMQPFFQDKFPLCSVDKADLKEVIKPCLEEWNWNDGVDAFLQYWFESEFSINEELVEAIKGFRFKGILCCLVTNQEKYRTEFMKREMKANEIFDKMYVFCEIGFKKPSKGFFEYIIKDLNIQAKKIAFFDDKQYMVDGGNHAGVSSFLYRDVAHIKKVIEF